MKGELINQAVELACASLGWAAYEITEVNIHDIRSETCLRFNAPAAVETCLLQAKVTVSPKMIYLIEIDAIFWMSQQEWELSNVQVVGALRRD